MDIGLLFKGLVIGLSVALPVGPISVLCIRRTLAKGRTHGLLSGLGAATADAFYGSIAGFGLTLVSDFLVGQQILIRLVGAGFLCLLGVKTFLAKPPEELTDKSHGLIEDYFTTFVLTVTNPLTILSFGAMFAGLGVGGAGSDYLSAAVLVVGVFGGSALWWLILSEIVGILRSRFASSLRWINRISGIIITGFSVAILLSLIV